MKQSNQGVLDLKELKSVEPPSFLSSTSDATCLLITSAVPLVLSSASLPPLCRALLAFLSLALASHRPLCSSSAADTDHRH